MVSKFFFIKNTYDTSIKKCESFIISNLYKNKNKDGTNSTLIYTNPYNKIFCNNIYNITLLSNVHSFMWALRI